MGRWFAGPGSECRGSRLLMTDANGSTAFASYRPDDERGGHNAWAIQLLEAGDDGIVGHHNFLDTNLFAVFGYRRLDRRSRLPSRSASARPTRSSSSSSGAGTSRNSIVLTEPAGGELQACQRLDDGEVATIVGTERPGREHRHHRRARATIVARAPCAGTSLGRTAWPRLIGSDMTVRPRVREHRTYVRIRSRGEPSCTRISTRSTRRSSNATTRRLKGRPVIVGGGVVLAASYEAKAYGVRTAMGGHQARRLCPGAVIVRPRMSAYSDASKAVFEVFNDTTPLVEGVSIDEAFLDVGGLRRIAGTPVDIARQLRRDVLDRVGLPITVGVARTKFLAKVASGVAKPDGLLVVPPDAELEFLHPLPVQRLWGVGPITAEKLQASRGDDGRGGRALGEDLARVDARSCLGPAPPRARTQP